MESSEQDGARNEEPDIASALLEQTCDVDHDLALEVLGNFFEFTHRLGRLLAVALHGVVQAVVDVIVDQHPLGVADSAFDGLQLLGDIEATSTCFHHGNNAAQMAFGPLQAFDDVGMGSVGAHSVDILSGGIG